MVALHPNPLLEKLRESMTLKSHGEMLKSHSTSLDRMEIRLDSMNTKLDAVIETVKEHDGTLKRLTA